MINSKSFIEILESHSDSTIEYFNQNMSKTLVSFNNTDQFPSEKGLYFVFLDNKIVYIGKADTQTIRKRCKQYVGNSSGATLRKKIEAVFECNQSEAINYIKDNLEAKFIINIKISNISVIEEVAIWAFQPILNAIKPQTFKYHKLRF